MRHLFTTTITEWAAGTETYSLPHGLTARFRGPGKHGELIVYLPANWDAARRHHLIAPPLRFGNRLTLAGHPLISTWGGYADDTHCRDTLPRGGRRWVVDELDRLHAAMQRREQRRQSEGHRYYQVALLLGEPA